MTRATTTGRVLLLAAVALVGLNLRPFITGIGPLAADISAKTGLDLKGISLLTLVPMLLMGIFAFAGPFLQFRIGARRWRSWQRARLSRRFCYPCSPRARTGGRGCG
jgi:cyanate permease